MLKRLYNKLLKNPTTVAETTETGTERTPYFSTLFSRRGDFQLNIQSYQAMGHFRVVFGLCLNESSYETIHIKMRSAYTFIFVQMKFIFV